MFYLPVLKVLEPRFNVEALALLLNIPPNKTLLRRHLATHFHMLIGSEAQRLKQDCLENPDYTVLTATAKVKVTARCFTTNPPCYREELFIFADSKQISGTKTGKPKVKSKPSKKKSLSILTDLNFCVFSPLWAAGWI